MKISLLAWHERGNKWQQNKINKHQIKQKNLSVSASVIGQIVILNIGIGVE